MSRCETEAKSTSGGFDCKAGRLADRLEEIDVSCLSTDRCSLFRGIWWLRQALIVGSLPAEKAGQTGRHR